MRVKTQFEVVRELCDAAMSDIDTVNDVLGELASAAHKQDVEGMRSVADRLFWSVSQWKEVVWAACWVAEMERLQERGCAKAE